VSCLYGGPTAGGAGARNVCRSTGSQNGKRDLAEKRDTVLPDPLGRRPNPLIFATMEPVSDDGVTMLLQQMREGDVDARARLIALVYPELKRMASRRLRSERRDHTLQPTALVHEVFVRFIGSAHIGSRDRVHFFALAAELMRHILIDVARRRRSAKRGGLIGFVELDEAVAMTSDRPEIILEIGRLLNRLQAVDGRQAQVVEMRYFAGLTEQEIADVLGISERTVKRDWAMARAWMRKELSPL
jgi:RNA polymerase sigma-70 factor, ECF subfamily